MKQRQQFKMSVPRTSFKNGEYKAWTVQVTVEVEVDLEAIANKLGPKAVRSKSGKSTGLSGAVVVRNLSIT